MRPSSTLITLAVTFSLVSLVAAEAKTLDKVKSATQTSWSTALNMAKMSTLGLANLTYHHPVKSALAATAGFGAFSIAKPVLVCKTFEKKYLKRYNAMKETYHEPGTDSKTFCINDDGTREYYTFFDEAARVMEEAFASALHSKDAHTLALKTERLGLRAVVQQTQSGNQHPLYLLRLFIASSALRPVLLELAALVKQGPSPFTPMRSQSEEEKTAMRYEALETIITTIVDEVDSVEDMEELREAFIRRVRQDNQTFREQGLEDGIINMGNVADIFDALLGAKQQ